MWDVLVTAVVAAVTARAGEDIGNAAQFSWTTVVGMLRRRLGPKATLIDAGDQKALEGAVTEVVEQDPVFAARMQALVWQDRHELELTIPRPALPSRTVARQLPAGPADFVNRVAELTALDQVRRHHEAGVTPVVVLRGAPGAGKNALAVRWGHKRQDWFDGGQFHADLRDPPDPVTGGPGPADGALTSFLMAMGIPGSQLPDDFASRVSLFRTLSSDRPVLVLVHGATAPAQVTTLIPTAPGSVVLVSTQTDLGGLAMDGAQFIDIGPLDEDAALALLVTVCGPERVDEDPTAAVRLIELCGRLPIAIRTAAGRLRLDPTMTISAFADEMTAEPYLLDALSLPGGSSSVAALFTTVYRRLDTEAQRLYRTFGAVPVTEVPDELLAYLGWPDRAVRQAAIDGLLGAKLLDRTSPGRYAMHSLIRAHADRLAQELEPGHAGRVVTGSIDYFCDFTESADRVIMGNRRRLTTGTTARDNRFAGPNPRAAALQALEHVSEDLLRIARVALAAQADEQVLRLATAAQALYFNHRHPADRMEMSRLAITAAQRLGRRDVEIQIRCTLSEAYADAGDLDHARGEIETALALLPEANDPVLAGTVWEFNARLLDRVARVAPAGDQAAARDQAEAAFHTTISIFAREGVDRGVALGHLFLGIFLDAAGRPADALPHLEQARDGLTAAADDRNATWADAAIGAAHLHVGAYRQAFGELATAAAYFAVAELWDYELGVRENLALAANALGDRTAAAEHAERASEIRRLSDPGK